MCKLIIKPYRQKSIRGIYRKILMKNTRTGRYCRCLLKDRCTSFLLFNIKEKFNDNLKELMLNIYLKKLYGCNFIDLNIYAYLVNKHGITKKYRITTYLFKGDVKKYVSIDLMKLISSSDLYSSDKLFLELYTFNYYGYVVFDVTNSLYRPFIQYKYTIEKQQNILENCMEIRSQKYQQEEIIYSNLLDEISEIKEKIYTMKEDILGIQEQIHRVAERKIEDIKKQVIDNIEYKKVEGKIVEGEDCINSKKDKIEVKQKKITIKSIKHDREEYIKAMRWILDKLVGEYVEIEIQDINVEYFNGTIIKTNEYYTTLKSNETYNYISIATILIIKSRKNIEVEEVSNINIQNTVKDILISIKEKGIYIELNTKEIITNNLEVLYVNNYLAKAKDTEVEKANIYYINLIFINCIKKIPINEEYNIKFI